VGLVFETLELNCSRAFEDRVRFQTRFLVPDRTSSLDQNYLNLLRRIPRQTVARMLLDARIEIAFPVCFHHPLFVISMFMSATLRSKLDSRVFLEPRFRMYAIPAGSASVSHRQDPAQDRYIPGILPVPSGVPSRILDAKTIVEPMFVTNRTKRF
jgi:hypothetical protein